jgi:hypothetical protein
MLTALTLSPTLGVSLPAAPSEGLAPTAGPLAGLAFNLRFDWFSEWHWHM